MNHRNYDQELRKRLEDEKEYGKHLLLHSCCAPCSSYVLEFLRQYYRITVFYYNPNITEEAEYQKRVEEEKRLIGAYNALPDCGEKVSEEKGAFASAFPIEIVEGEYHTELFYEIAKDLENCPEGGERCFRCYALRLRETAKQAATVGADYFTTTLTISPLKNAQKLNEIGQQMAEEYNIPWLNSDFKKKGGYQRSIELSAQYDLYRQDYCGCIYSKRAGLSRYVNDY